MNGLKWWMRVVGAVYVFGFLASSVLRLPIRAEGPPGILEHAASGDATARFVLDTWFTLGVYMGAAGIGLLVASRTPERARMLVWTVMGMELAGIVADINKVAHGTYAAPLVWMAVHAAIIAVGFFLQSRTHVRGLAASS